jgi:putative copper export protein
MALIFAVIQINNFVPILKTGWGILLVIGVIVSALMLRYYDFD